MSAIEVIKSLLAGDIGEEESIDRLVALGFDEDDARKQTYVALGGDDVIASKKERPRIERDVAMTWWNYFDVVAHVLELAHAADGGQHRLPTNPRHTADCLRGGAMLCAAVLDEYCRGFAATRRWPDEFGQDELYYLQHRLCLAKSALDYMTTQEYSSDWNVHVLRTTTPDPRDESNFIEFLLVGVWDVMSEGYLDGVTKELQSLLAPGELERLEAENPPLSG
jgi:hypothetical protein